MNCYYSNLIEGHDTHLIDIERALRDDDASAIFSLKPGHTLRFKAWIDRPGRRTAWSRHRRFCEMVPEDLLRAEDTRTERASSPRRAPGARCQGRPMYISPGALPRFLERFETAYTTLGDAAAAAHHRALDSSVRRRRCPTRSCWRAGGVWSIARGLAPSAKKPTPTHGRATRRNDLDGRAKRRWPRSRTTTCRSSLHAVQLRLNRMDRGQQGRGLARIAAADDDGGGG